MNERPASSRSLRAACDACHQSKVKCSGGPLCDNCVKLRHFCNFSAGSRRGRPKGSPNKASKKPRKRRILLEEQRASCEQQQSSDAASKSKQWSNDWSVAVNIAPDRHSNLKGASNNPCTKEATTEPHPAGFGEFVSTPSWEIDTYQGTGILEHTSPKEPHVWSGGATPQHRTLDATSNNTDRSAFTAPLECLPDPTLSLPTAPTYSPSPIPSCSCLDGVLDLLKSVKLMERTPTDFPKAVSLHALRKLVQDCQMYQQCQRCEDQPDLDTLLFAAQCLRSPLRMLKSAKRGHTSSTRYRWSVMPLGAVSGPISYDLTSDEQDDLMDVMIRQGLRHIYQVWQILYNRCSNLMRSYSGHLPSQAGCDAETLQLYQMLQSIEKLLAELMHEFE